MREILVELLPVMIGAALLPVWIIIVLFLLRGESGKSKAAAFVGGALSVRLLQGVVFGFLFETAMEQSDEGSADLMTSTLLLIVGIVLLLAAVKKWRKATDPDAPPPGWKETLHRATPVKAFGAGALLMSLALKQWVFTLSAIAVIEQGALSQRTNLILYLIFALAAQTLMFIPILVALIAPTRSQRWLEIMEEWLERNERVIMVGVSLIFGVWFFWRGVSGLSG